MTQHTCVYVPMQLNIHGTLQKLLWLQSVAFKVVVMFTVIPMFWVTLDQSVQYQHHSIQYNHINLLTCNFKLRLSAVSKVCDSAVDYVSMMLLQGEYTLHAEDLIPWLGIWGFCQKSPSFAVQPFQLGNSRPAFRLTLQIRIPISRTHSRDDWNGANSWRGNKKRQSIGVALTIALDTSREMSISGLHDFNMLLYTSQSLHLYAICFTFTLSEDSHSSKSW